MCIVSTHTIQAHTHTCIHIHVKHTHTASQDGKRSGQAYFLCPCFFPLVGCDTEGGRTGDLPPLESCPICATLHVAHQLSNTVHVTVCMYFNPNFFIASSNDISKTRNKV